MMLPYLTALVPAAYVIFRLCAKRRLGYGAAVLAAASVAGLLLDWRLAVAAFAPLLLALLLVELFPGTWNPESDRSVHLAALWAAARCLAIPLPFGAGLLIRFGVPRGLPILESPTFDLRTVSIGVLAFLSADLTNYFTHRARHRLGILWRFHEIHHSDLALSPVSARRQHVGDFLIARFGRLLPFMVVGPTYLMGFLPWLVVRSAAGFYHHGGTRLSLGPLGRVITTPAVHRLHHSTRPEHLDCNFGGVLIVWDKIFGTYVAPTGELVPTGVLGGSLPNESESSAPLLAIFGSQFVAPFRRSVQPVPSMTQAT